MDTNINIKREALVSVIIPVKNRKLELRRCLTSVLSQTFPEFEVLVIDDKSEENIESVVLDFNDARIKYVRNSKPKSNANVCRNIGIALARGEYIAMLDSDDEWLPNHLKTKIDFLHSHNCDGVFGSVYVDNGTESKLKISRTRLPDERMLDYLLTTGKAPTPTHVYKASCARQIKWDEELQRNQDYDFSARFAERFTFLADTNPTVVVHWKKGEKRTQHNASRKLFLEKNMGRISLQVLAKYCAGVYNELKKDKATTADILSFYKRTAIEHFAFLSRADFQQFASSKRSFSLILNRIEFSIRALLN